MKKHGRWAVLEVKIIDFEREQFWGLARILCEKKNEPSKPFSS